VRRIASIKEKEDVIGNRTRVKVVKNKVAPPYRSVEFDIMYGHGISYEGDLLDLATDRSLVQKSGSWYSLEGERIGQGRENAKNWLAAHPDAATKLEAKVLAVEGPAPKVSASADDDSYAEE
jgi:recombination protein RecA